MALALGARKTGVQIPLSRPTPFMEFKMTIIIDNKNKSNFIYKIADVIGNTVIFFTSGIETIYNGINNLYTNITYNYPTNRAIGLLVMLTVLSFIWLPIFIILTNMIGFNIPIVIKIILIVMWMVSIFTNIIAIFAYMFTKLT